MMGSTSRRQMFTTLTSPSYFGKSQCMLGMQTTVDHRTSEDLEDLSVC